MGADATLPPRRGRRQAEHAPAVRRHCVHVGRRYKAPVPIGMITFVGSTAIFITPAFAQAAAAAPTGTETIIQYLTLFGPIILIMYFLILRPQQRAARSKTDMLKNLRRGDTVVMSGGLIGRVAKVVDDAELEVEIAPNVRVRVARPMVAEVRAKGEPVKGEPVKTIARDGNRDTGKDVGAA